jgi:magnesium-transporting ATPase (P-type)
MPERALVALPEFLLLALPVLAAYLCAGWGFAAMALRQERHRHTVFKSNKPTDLKNTAQAAIQIIATGLSFVLCVVSHGASFGALLWLLLLSLSAASVALLLTWAPCVLRRFFQPILFVFSLLSNWR